MRKPPQMPGPELCALSAQSWETLVELDAKYDDLLHRLNNLEKEVTQVLARYTTGEKTASQSRQDARDSGCHASSLGRSAAENSG